MLRIIFAALCILAGGAMAQDNRGLGPDAMNAVGRIDIGATGFCTGALVASDIVLTAAHCLYDKQTSKKFSLDQMRFRVGVKVGQSDSALTITQTHVHPGYRPTLKGELTNMRNDVALLRLSRPVSSSIAKPMPIGFPDMSGAAARVVSYGVARAETALMQEGCQLSLHHEGVLLSSCQAQLGTSGAPVIQMRQGRPTIVSIVSAKARADHKPVALTVLVAEALRNTKSRFGAQFTPAGFVAD